MTPDDIRRAIITHKQVIATYRGHRREFSPHILGAYKDQWRVLGWQFGGSSATGLEPGGAWRCFVLDELEDGEVRSGKWVRGVHVGYDPSCVDTIDTEIDAAFAPRRAKR